MNGRLSDLNMQHGLSAGITGQSLGGIGGSRPTPAEDVVDAIGRLNAAIRAAAKAGWLLTPTLGDVSPSFAGEGPTYPVITISISKQV